jgi:protein-disulfide isomerase
VSLVFKHYPVSNHPRAMPTARASWAAHQQGRFWALHDQFYRVAPKLSDADIDRAGQAAGLDLTAWNAARRLGRADQVIAADKAEGLRAGVQGTPTFFVNGKQYHGRKDYVELKDRLEEELMLLRGGK